MTLRAAVVGVVARAAIFAVLAAAVPNVVKAAGGAAEPPDPCRLVDRHEASRALGMPIVELKLATMAPSSRTCTMRTTNLLRSVIVTVWRWRSPAEAHVRFDSLVAETSSRMGPTVAIAELGDEARSIASNVYARDGAGVIAVALIDGTVGPGRTARTAALARRALARMRQRSAVP
jgi:hypothetical protein